MTLGNKKFRELTFSHTGDASTVTQIIKLPEGGAAGYYSVFYRRTKGSDSASVLIKKGFNQDVEYGYVEFDSSWYGGWWQTQDYIQQIIWSNSNDTPYLSISVSFGDEGEEQTDIEFYIVAF